MPKYTDTILSKRKKLYDLQKGSLNLQSRRDSFTVADSTISKFNITPYLPLLYSMLVGCFFSISNAFTKKLTYINVGELAVIQNLTGFVFSIPIVFLCRKDVLGTKQQLYLLIIRGFLNSTALYLQMIGYRYLPIAEAATITSILPVIVFVTARFYLKEPIGCVQVLALILTVAGMLISARVPELSNDKESITGMSCSLAGVLLLSFAYILIRKMTEIHFSVILFHSGWMGALWNAILTYLLESYSVPRCGWDRLEPMMVGVFAFLGQICLILAFQTELAGITATMRSAFEIVISIILQVVFFASIPDMYNTIGALLVLIALSILTFRTWFLSLPDDSPAKRRLRNLRTSMFNKS